jgi:hypothetical protein
MFRYIYMATESNPIETERSGKFRVSRITSRITNDPSLIKDINSCLKENIDNSIYLYDTDENLSNNSRITRLSFSQDLREGEAWTNAPSFINFDNNFYIEFEGKELKQLLKDHYPSLDWTTGNEIEHTVEPQPNTGGASRFGKKKKARTNKKKKRTTKKRKSKTNKNK